MQTKRSIYKDFWKAHDCQNCLHFKGVEAGCSLGEDNCFLNEEKPKVRDYCDGCCYGKSSPCIGSCIAIDLVEMRLRKNEIDSKAVVYG